MEREVAVIGAGVSEFGTTTGDLSWKELMYQAASRAYADAGVNPRKDVRAFVTCAEDYWEGFGIFDEFVPDQMGGAQRPVFTVCGDGLNGLAQGYMLVKTGLFDLVAVEAHSKASDLLTYGDVLLHAFDPIYNKPLGGHPYYVAGLEMDAFLSQNGNTERQCAHVVAKNKANARSNPLASHDAPVTVEDVLASPKWFDPLKRLDAAPLADGCTVLVLGDTERARRAKHPVWLSGIGWNQDSAWLETRDWTRAVYAELAARQAYKMAGLANPPRQIHVAEVDDKFSYKELQHLEALGLAAKGQAGHLTETGDFAVGGRLPVNPSGGSLGVGNLLEGSGLYRGYEIVQQLRGHAGAHQVRGASVGVAQSWRGVPTATGAVAVFTNGGA